jgi:16S rRNA A1518/A1519 N6-dimethyltransferase RsmA/KsgA/DIM1 with predicted DNA glycosylase/AP lyase activity
MVISDFVDFEPAWKEQYAKVAKLIARKLSRAGGYIVEVGCGKGQLTVPLAELVKNYHFVAVDNFAGPYLNDARPLRSAI